MSHPEEESKFKEELRRGEYEIQLFELTSFCLVHELEELLLTNIRNVINALRQKLLEKFTHPEENERLESIINALSEKYERATRTQFKKLESKIIQIFNVPSHILLPEDETQKHQYTSDDFKNIDNEIEKLKSLYRRAIHLESMLKRERETYSNLTIIEKRKLELEDNINKLAQICASNKDTLKKTYDDLNDLIEKIGKINVFLENECSAPVGEKFLLDKIF